MENTAVLTRSPPIGMWKRVCAHRVGPVPLVLYTAIALTVICAAAFKRLPADMLGGFACIMLLGYLLGDIGSRAPWLRSIGGPAILCLFVPSALIGFKMFDAEVFKSISALMKTSNFLYLYITCLVTGSMLGMDKKTLIQGFCRMFVPLLIGDIIATAAGISIGLLFGYEPKHVFFYTILPIISGGIGEGILPLSIAYSETLSTPQPAIVAMIIPAALIGNILAITSAGILKHIGEKSPRHSGRGALVISSGITKQIEQRDEKHIDLKFMGTGLLVSCSMFILGSLLSPVIGIPAPIVIIIGAATLKICAVIPHEVETGTFQMYKFMTTTMTYPLLVGLGALYIPWNDLTRAVSFGYVCVCSTVVFSVIISGWVVGRLLNMHPVESAIVTSCHCGLGGTGAVAILSASNRMVLMPFAQTSTRIGGAIMVILGVGLFKMLN